MKTFNKITISFTLLICLLFSYSLLYQVYLEQTGPIYDNTLRFHVRADSDKKEAQERKLIVRDAVLRYVKEDVYRADSAQKLKQNLAEKTEEIAQVAANASDGKPVRVYFCLLYTSEKYNKKLAKNPSAFYNPDEIKGYEKILDISGTGIMGYITIKKLGVELPIYHGTDEGILQIAAGHLKGTSFPVGGDSTHLSLIHISYCDLFWCWHI